MQCFLFLQGKRSVNEFIKSGEIFTGKQGEAMKINSWMNKASTMNAVQWEGLLLTHISHAGVYSRNC